MAYTTTANLVARFGERLVIQLTDRAEEPTGAIVASVAEKAITDTDAVIDGFIASRYALPMAATPPLIAEIAEQIAIYKLHIYTVDPKIEADYQSAMKILAGINNGKIRLPVAGVETPGTGGTGARVTDRERPMTAQNLKGFI